MCQPQFLAVSFDFDSSLYYLEMVEEKAKVGTYSCSKVYQRELKEKLRDIKKILLL